uniref:Uncharacterized protein n=1 Tax=Brassica campestris TaxID=3711 RepID=A0A3P5Z7I5_BRACM|nr:unnamed protein product [Brassica rapa]
MDGHLSHAPAATGSWIKRALPCYICVSSNITGVLSFKLYTPTNFLILHSYIYIYICFRHLTFCLSRFCVELAVADNNDNATFVVVNNEMTN